MEGLKVFLKDAPQESSPAPGTAPLNEDQPTVALRANEEASESAPRENLVSTSPNADAEMGKDDSSVKEAKETTLTMEEENKASSEDNNEPLSFEENNVTISVPWTTSEARFDDSETVKEENASIKIIARLSPDDDDLVPSFSSPQTVNSPDVQSAKIAMKSNQIEQSSTPAMPRTRKTPRTPRTPGAIGQVDTTSSLESVKSVVSKFGGIVDWKAHRLQTMERRKTIEQELEKAQEEIPIFKKQSEEAKEAKNAVIKELDSTKRLIEELKLNLERAETEEQQARQDSELAKLRVEELEQGVADEVSVAAMAQLEVAQARHASALSEFRTVELEVKQLRRDYDMLVAEKDAYAKKAEDALAMSEEIERTVENLTVELISAKISLEYAHAAHMEAEEDIIGAVMAKEQNMLDWEKELKQAEEDLERMSRQVDLSKDLRSKLDSASALLQDLKAGLATYMEFITDHDSGKDVVEDTDKKTRVRIEAALSSAKKKLDEVKLNLENKTNEVNILKMTATSLKSELEMEKAELSTIQQREEMASSAVVSLEAELERTESEILIIQLREKEHRERMVVLPKKLQEAAQEADQAKSLSHRAREELLQAKEEAEQVKASKSTAESRLRAAQKEIEAAKASEMLALAAINALQESESTQSNEENLVTLSLIEYYELNKKAHEAEELAKNRVADALAEIELAKESELNTLSKLEEANRETVERKNALEAALQKAEKAKEGKLAVEQELRKWRDDHEQRRKSGETVSKAVSFERVEAKKNHSSMFKSAPLAKTNTSSEVKVAKKKRSFFPKLFRFLGKKKSSSSKSSL